MNAEMPKEMVPNTSNCGKGIVWFATNQNSGGFYFNNMEHKERMLRAYSALDDLPCELTEIDKAYSPQPGDYVYFRWKNAAGGVNVSHVGVVVAVTAEHIITCEGNAGARVAQHAYEFEDNQIVGYGRLRYEDLFL